MKALAFGAHPDDVEFTCAGTLIRLSREHGWEIAVATFTPGDCGSATLGPEEIAAIRRVEARRAAENIGAAYFCLEERDGNVDSTKPIRQKVVELLRKVRPNLVFSPPLQDYMLDHENAGRVVRDACFLAPLKNYSTDISDPAPAAEPVPYLYYVDPLQGKDTWGQWVPFDFVIDISTVIEVKLAMLACHESQRAWLAHHHGIDNYLEALKRWARSRGEQVSVAYGEAFRQHISNPYPSDNILTKLLEARSR